MDNSAKMVYDIIKKEVISLIRYVSFDDLGAEIFYAENIECYRQIWADGTKWTQYIEQPRKLSGISLICSNISAQYILSDGSTRLAAQGDMVSLGRGSCYSVSFHDGGKETDLYTINFVLRDQDGNELRLTQGVQIYRAVAIPACIKLASDLYEACLFSESNLKKQALLLRLLDCLATFFQRHSETFYPIRRGVTLLMKEWNQNQKISVYAEASGISERSFYDFFKKWVGKSPVDYRNELRTTAAASLLSNTNLSISEIAAQVGFEDPYYFSRVFKKNIGISPAFYRKNGGKYSV